MSASIGMEDFAALPPEYDKYSSEDLLTKAFPFVWQPSLKTNMWEAILTRASSRDEASLEALHQRTKLVENHCIMPPKVSQHVDTLLNWLSPEVITALHDSDTGNLETVQEVFETDVLKLDDGAPSRRSRYHASGILLPGTYPTANFANAYRTTSEILLDHLVRYRHVGSVVLLRTGSFITQVKPEDCDSDYLSVGDTWKISSKGNELVRFTLGLLDAQSFEAEA